MDQIWLTTLHQNTPNSDVIGPSITKLTECSNTKNLGIDPLFLIQLKFKFCLMQEQMAQAMKSVC